jgi:hypothetical protein
MDGSETRQYGDEVRRLKLGDLILCQRLVNGEWTTFWTTDGNNGRAEGESGFACRVMQRKLAGLPVLRERVGDA